MTDVRRTIQALFVASVLGGGPAAAAIDITNSWVFEIEPPGLVNCLVHIQQTGTVLDLDGGCSNGIIDFGGTIDSTSGAFTGAGTIVAGNPPHALGCLLSGVASPSGTALSGTFDCSDALLTFTAGLCRNGNLDAGEACDTGFGTQGCCTASCTLKPDDTPCTNASGCQTDEACSSGVCAGVPRASGSACDLDGAACSEDTCDGGGACVAGPCSACCRELAGNCIFDATCTRPLSAQSRFKLTTGTPTGRDRLAWKLPKLADTTLAEFGDPTVNTSIAVCPYYVDEIFGARLLTAFRAPAGTTCGSRPCWKSTRTGFKYRDRENTPDGLTSIVLKAGTGGRARIVAKGRGPNLPDWPGLPHPPLGVLLRAGDRCWGAEYLNPVEQPGAIDATNGQ